MKPLLIIIDVQGRLAEQVIDAKSNLDNTHTLVKIADLLDVPIFYIEHCPNQLGPTHAQLAGDLAKAYRLEKFHFSAWQELGVRSKIKDFMRQNEDAQIVLCGMESHVCVYQTTSDLLDQGYSVQVIQDATSSRSHENWALGIRRMEKEGAIITSVEMWAFELMKTPQHPMFKAVLNLIK